MTFRWEDETGVKGFDPGATVVVGFPSAGLAATVAAHYIVQSLNLPRIAVLDSPDTLPLAVIQSGKVQPPIRVYGRSDVGVVVSEFPVLPDQATALAEAILDGSEKGGAGLVLSLEGVVPHPSAGEPETSEETVWTIQARNEDALAARFAKAGTRPLEDGIVGGLSGALLVAGIRRKIPTSTMLVSARVVEGYPDHRAGAVLIEVLDKLLPHLEIDTGPLRSQAEVIEKVLRAAMKNRTRAGSLAEAPSGDLPIYQ